MMGRVFILCQLLLSQQIAAFSSPKLHSNFALSLERSYKIQPYTQEKWISTSLANEYFTKLKMSTVFDYDNEDTPLEKETPFIHTENGLSNTQLIMNGLLLSAAFGFALYQLFTIDSEITRGWTQAEIVMRIPMDSWKGYEDSLSEKPIFTKTMINVVIYLLGDWLSQTLFQKRNVLDFDAQRTMRNGFIGLCFGPLVHWYYEFSDYILPVVGINRLYKIIMDQTIYLMTKVSIYIVAVGLLAGEPLEDCVNNVKTKIKPITFTAWKFWPLVHCVTYTVIPAQHRILWVNCVDLVWNAILALMAGKKGEEEIEQVGETVIEDSFNSKFESLSEMLKNETYIEIFEPDYEPVQILNNTGAVLPHFLANDTALETVSA